MAHFAGPSAHVSRRPAAALTAPGLVGDGLQERLETLHRWTMDKEPPFRLNLFKESHGDAKDWYGFLNIKQEDIPAWIDVLNGRPLSDHSSKGDKEIVICVVGFNSTPNMPERGIRIEQKIRREELNQRHPRKQTR